MARRLPKSFTSTPEEDEYFEKAKAADAAAAEEEEVVEEAAEAEAEPEAAVEEEAAPEGEADESTDDEAPEEDEKPARSVPIGALHEEREKRKQLQAKIDQMEATFEKFASRLNQQQQPAAPAAPEAPPIPSYEEDPVAHLKARIDQLSQLSAGTYQQVQQQTAMTKLGEAIGLFDAQMRAKVDDYDAAIEFAKRSRDAELAALGYVDPEQRMDLMRQEILGTTAFCIQRGQNPAEAFYNYAKVRGWQGPNGAPTPVPAAPSPAKKLATVAKAQAAAGKPITRGGTAPKAAVTLADLATMDDEEFDKHFDRVMRKT